MKAEDQAFSTSHETRFVRKGAAATKREQREDRRSVDSWRHLWCGECRLAYNAAMKFTFRGPRQKLLRRRGNFEFPRGS